MLRCSYIKCAFMPGPCIAVVVHWGSVVATGVLCTAWPKGFPSVFLGVPCKGLFKRGAFWGLLHYSIFLGWTGALRHFGVDSLQVVHVPQLNSLGWAWRYYSRWGPTADEEVQYRKCVRHWGPKWSAGWPAMIWWCLYPIWSPNNWIIKAPIQHFVAGHNALKSGNEDQDSIRCWCLVGSCFESSMESWSHPGFSY